MTFLWLNKEDANFIAEFFQENFADGWTKEMINSAFDTGRFKCLSAMDDGIVGIITFSYAGDSADVEDIVVKKCLRKKGVGTALLDEALKVIKADGVEKVFLEVREGNIPAKNLYEKFGFEIISVRKKYYVDGENALVMEKGL